MALSWNDFFYIFEITRRLATFEDHSQIAETARIEFLFELYNEYTAIN